ncbi:ABC transporter ATP-binding protein [Streptomyces sp. PmtG]
MTQDEAPRATDRRSAGRFLWWLVTIQRGRVAAGSLLGVAWMTGLMIPPYVLSRAIDEGLEPRHWPALVGWSGLLLAAGGINAACAIALHRRVTRIRMHASFRTAELVASQSTRLGAAFSRQATTGEVVTIGMQDVVAIGNALTFTGPGFGAVSAFLLATALLLSVSAPLAVVVLLGTVVMVTLVGVLLGRLLRVDTAYRERQGRLVTRLVDMVTGLGVLGGLGGKTRLAGRYRSESQTLRHHGYRVGAVTSWVDALGVGLPALFLGVVTWLAARLAAQGTITVGEFVAVYGYVAVLTVPVSFLIKSGRDITKGLVASRRVTRFLSLEPDTSVPDHLEPPPRAPAALTDPASGVEVRPGRLTMLASAQPTDPLAIVDRLAGFADSTALWGDVPISRIATAWLRERVVVADNDAELFSGTLREILAGRTHRDEQTLDRAVCAAMAQDVVQALPHGLDSFIEAGGRNLSGGQRQRVRLARVLAADPEVLLAVEPTSAVDAHTAAAIAIRLRTARAGRTTLVATTSPLLLAQADTVHHLVDGKVADTGTHGELLAASARYRALVTPDDRGKDDGHGDGTALAPAAHGAGE